MSSFKKEKQIQQSITDSINKILSEAVVNGFTPPVINSANNFGYQQSTFKNMDGTPISAPTSSPTSQPDKSNAVVNGFTPPESTFKNMNGTPISAPTSSPTSQPDKSNAVVNGFTPPVINSANNFGYQQSTFKNMNGTPISAPNINNKNKTKETFNKFFKAPLKSTNNFGYQQSTFKNMDGTAISAPTSQTGKSNVDNDTEDVDVTDWLTAHNNRVAANSMNPSSPNFVGPPAPGEKTRDTIGNNVWGNPVVNGVEGDSPFNNKTVPFTPDFSGDAPPNLNLSSNKTKKQSSEISPSDKKAAPGISVPFKYDFSQDVPKQNLISTGAGINNGGVFGPPSSLADPEKQDKETNTEDNTPAIGARTHEDLFGDSVPRISGIAEPKITPVTPSTEKKPLAQSPFQNSFDKAQSMFGASDKKAAPGISVPFKYDFSQDVPKQNLISTGAGINNGGVFGPPSSLSNAKYIPNNFEKNVLRGDEGQGTSKTNDPRAEVWNSLLLPKKSPETTGASIINKQTPMGTPNTSGTAIRSPFVAKPQVNTPATNPGFMVSPQGAPASRPSQTGDFKVTPANPNTPATNPGFMAPSQNVPNSSKYKLGVSTNTELDKQTGTNGRNIGDMRKENEQYAQAAKDRGEPVLVGSPEWVAWNRAKNQKRLDDAGINKTVDQVVSPQPETASDVVGGAAAAAAAYRNNPTGVAGRNAPAKMPPRGGGSNVGLSTPSDSSGTPLYQSVPSVNLTPQQMRTDYDDKEHIDDIAKVAWWKRTSPQRDVMKKNEDEKATAQRTADVDRVQAQRNATAAREKDELESLGRYRERQNVHEQTRDPNDPLYGLNIKQGPKRDLDADTKSLAVKAGQFGINAAKGALKLGTLIAIPPQELMATATGRMSDLGFSKQGAKRRFDHYRNKIDQAPGALTGIIGDAGSLLKNVAPGLSNTLGKSAGNAIDAVTGSKLGKAASAVAGSNTGKAIAGEAESYENALKDETANLMTLALYEPRSKPNESEYVEPKDTKTEEDTQNSTSTPSTETTPTSAPKTSTPKTSTPKTSTPTPGGTPTGRKPGSASTWALNRSQIRNVKPGIALT